jgi:NADH-quinone oxidoreductase subunit H
MFLSQIVSSLIICLLILLSVAFFTLFERKVIGLFHLRVGPDKVSFVGIAQPLLDAFKLLTKQPITPFKSNKIFYSTSPLLALLLGLIV